MKYRADQAPHMGQAQGCLGAAMNTVMFCGCTGPSSSLTSSTHTKHHLLGSVQPVADRISAGSCLNHTQHWDGYHKPNMVKHIFHNICENTSQVTIIMVCSSALKTQLHCKDPKEKRTRAAVVLCLFYHLVTWDVPCFQTSLVFHQLPSSMSQKVCRLWTHSGPWAQHAAWCTQHSSPGQQQGDQRPPRCSIFNACINAPCFSVIASLLVTFSRNLMSQFAQFSENGEG